MRKVYAMLCVMVALCIGGAQAMAVVFGDPITYGGSGHDLFQAATPMPGGGLLLAGQWGVDMDNPEAGVDSVYPRVICVDNQGNMVWDMVSDSLDRAGIIRAAARLSDGCFALIRVENKTGPNTCHALILSAEGEELGVYRLADAACDIEANGDGFLVSLYRWGGKNHTARIPYVTQMSAEGESLWTQSFEELPYGEIWDLRQADDGGMLLLGRTRDEEDGLYRGFAARLDGQQLTWIFKTPGVEGNDYVSDGVPLEDGGVAIAVQHAPIGAGSDEPEQFAQMSVIRLDAEGKPMWKTPLPSGEADRHVVQIAAWQDGFITASNTKGKPDVHNQSGEYIQYEVLDAEGRLLQRDRTKEMTNKGMTVRFVQSENGRTYLYGTSSFEDSADCFLMEVQE